MHKSINHLKTNLLFFLGVVTCLIIFGLVFVYSASSVYALGKFGSAHYYVRQHCLGIVVGLIALCAGRYIPCSWVESYAGLAYLAAFLLTSLTLVPPFGISVHGSRRWLHLIGPTFQPSEILKIAFILATARFLSKKELKIQQDPGFQSYIPFLCLIGLNSLLLLVQPDFGLTVTLASTAFVVAYTAGLPLKKVGYTILGAIPPLVALILLKPYRFKRILTFVDPWSDPKGAGFQIIQSLIAIGSGSIWGTGITQSKQKFFYLPMQHTDFIFSIIAEETGFLGVLFLISTYILLLYFGLRCATVLRSAFARYSIIGFVILLSLQACINIAVSSGLAPTKGIGLPLVSYGNTSLVCTLFAIGLIINFIVNDKRA